MKKLFSGGTTEKLKASNNLFLITNQLIIMSTFQKSAINKFRIQQGNVIRNIERSQLDELNNIIQALATPAIKLEEFIIRYIPKFQLNISTTEPIHITTIIVLIKSIVEQEIQLQQIEQDTLFTRSDY